MKTIKIIASFFVMALVVFTGISAFAVEKSAGLSENNIIEIVAALEIMQGDQYGNLNLDNKVTRAEFVKMAVNASSNKENASAKPSYSLFPDVSANHWASGYIKSAIDMELINGYLDGTFKPSGNVKLEEAVNITLKLLGYTNSDFSGIYPSGQIAKYESLNLDIDISAKCGDELTRRECMYLIYNLLCTNTKNGTAYAKTLGYEIDTNGNIDYSALMNSKKEDAYVVRNANEVIEKISSLNNFSIYKDGKEISANQINTYDVLYYSPDFRTIWIHDDKTVGIIEEFYPNSKSPEKVLISGKTYSVTKNNSLKSGRFSINDSVVLLVGENDELVEVFKTEKAFVSESFVGIAANNFYLNNSLINISDITEKSLIYICPEMSCAFMYDSKISGVITSLSPSKQKPESIIISGKTYTISENIKNLFENENTFGESDFVTIYLGGSGKIEYIEHADIYDAKIYTDNNLSYETLVSQTLKGPVIVKGSSWQNELKFPIDTATFYQNGKKVDASIINDFDCIYHSTTFKSVWIYSDKVTGVIENIKPNTLTPTSVIVAGNEYPLETPDAAISFSSSGEYTTGDTVTLIIGKSGVVSVENPKNVSGEYMGISTDVSKKEYVSSNGKTYSDYYVTVKSFDGRTHTVKTDNPNFQTNVCVVVTYSDGNMNIRQLHSSYTDISKLKEAVRENKISPNATIVDCYKKTFIKTYPARLSEIELSPKNVIYYNINTDGLLDYLILNDATGDMHSYGVIMNNKGNYNFLTSSKNNSIDNFVVPARGPVCVKYNDGESIEMDSLFEVVVTSIDENLTKCGGLSYKIWDYCEYFVGDRKNFLTSKDSNDSLSDVIKSSSKDYIKTLLEDRNYVVRAYFDSNKMVRTIIAQKTYGY